jgi:peptidoglycan/LPS O-acetylase OafA/YrhL
VRGEGDVTRGMEVRLRWPGMRWTKAALIVFGVGLALGFAVVVDGGHPRLERAAAATMALALAALPLALFADGHGLVLIARVAARLRRRRTPPPAKRRAPAARRKPPAKPSGRPPAKSRTARRRQHR